MELSKQNIIITRFIKQDKPALKGFFSIQIPQYAGLCINDLSYFEKGDQRWISYPQRAYEKDGEKKYSNVIFFEEKSMQNVILKALDDYLKKPPKKQVDDENHSPF